jgi:ATP/maltotriose-dependent transcriptional regulator MalT
MRIDEVEFTELEAIHLTHSASALATYLERTGLPWSAELRKKLWDRYDSASEEALATYERMGRRQDRETWRGWRPDSRALTRFVDAQPGLAERMRQVFELCVRQGLSLDACAAQLQIGRATVRTHLRRLRELARQYGALDDLEPLEWDVPSSGCQKGRAPRPVGRDDG